MSDPRRDPLHGRRATDAGTRHLAGPAAGRPCVLAIAGATAAVAVAAALAVTGCGSTTHDQTLKLDSELSSISNVKLLPVASIGQQLIFTAQLFAPNAASAIGRSQASCTRTGPGDGEVYDCQLVFTLPDGTLYGLSASSHSGPASGVIAGGSGKYARMRGTFRYVATGDPRLTLTFSLAD